MDKEKRDEKMTKNAPTKNYVTASNETVMRSAKKMASKYEKTLKKLSKN